MKQTTAILGIYAADTSGACSALYELGGMSVIHDASGCNSTYTTHDEPRWYHHDSMVFISGLTEADAILGNDTKLVGDLINTASQLHPRFIALCGSPVPMMVGTDYEALAIEVRLKTGIPCFGIKSDGMHSYLHGASQAFLAVCQEFCDQDTRPSTAPAANILGLTPLDFSTNGSAQSIRKYLEEIGFHVICSLAMDGTLEDVRRMGEASVNLVVSHSGLAAAQWLHQQFGTPFVAAVPIGERFPKILATSLANAGAEKRCAYPCAEARTDAAGPAVLIPGEAVFAGSLAAAIEAETTLPTRVLCPLEHAPGLLRASDAVTEDEDEIASLFAGSRAVLADPLYRPVCPARVPFHPLPHEAYSGRCFRASLPNLITSPVASLLADQEAPC